MKRIVLSPHLDHLACIVNTNAAAVNAYQNHSNVIVIVIAWMGLMKSVV